MNYLNTPLSPHISWNEATSNASAVLHGVTNIPNDEEWNNMLATAANIFEPVRAWHRSPITVHSMFRNQELNAAVGGSTNSQHIYGQAIDMDLNDGVLNMNAFFYILDNLPFDQIIAEDYSNGECNWIHASYNIRDNRGKMSIKPIGDPNYHHFYKKSDLLIFLSTL